MNTTISISKETREKIKEFGAKGESYDEIIQKLYKSAKERQLHDLLLGDSGSATVDDALKRARKQWQ